MPYRAVEIANEFLRLPGAKDSITQMQLQKLVYIAHGWNLVINNQALVRDTPQAWEYGPVYRDLYDHTKFFGKSPIGREISPDDSDLVRFFIGGVPLDKPYKASLTDRERAVILHVWRRYGNLDAVTLSALTHQKGTPWFETFTTKGRNAPISNELIVPHYKQLAENARVRAATAA